MCETTIGDLCGYLLIVAIDVLYHGKHLNFHGIEKFIWDTIHTTVTTDLLLGHFFFSFVSLVTFLFKVGLSWGSLLDSLTTSTFKYA